MSNFNFASSASSSAAVSEHFVAKITIPLCHCNKGLGVWLTVAWSRLVVSASLQVNFIQQMERVASFWNPDLDTV